MHIANATLMRYDHRNMSKRVEILIQNIPVDVRDALVADAATRDISINEAAVQILAKAYKIKREPSTRPHRGENGSSQILLVVPDELRTAVRVDAATRGVTIRSLVIDKIAKRYKVPVPA